MNTQEIPEPSVFDFIKIVICCFIIANLLAYFFSKPEDFGPDRCVQNNAARNVLRKIYKNRN
jgi:hypothetical protein